MGEGVAVAVRLEPTRALTGDDHPAEHEGPAGIFGEPMDVESVPDPQTEWRARLAPADCHRDLTPVALGGARQRVRGPPDG